MDDMGTSPRRDAITIQSYPRNLSALFEEFLLGAVPIGISGRDTVDTVEDIDR